MDGKIEARVYEGLERSCEDGISGRIIAAPAVPGIERIEARFRGRAFDLHRHDTYAVGVTLRGVQTFRYRGRSRVSRPGEVIVLHPDELHDGGAGTEEGLRYRILYLEPSLLQEGLGEGAWALPFVADPVVRDVELRDRLLAALDRLDDGLDELFVDDFVAGLAEGLARHAGTPVRPLGSTAWKAASLARDYLEAHSDRLVRSGELEALTGLDRYALARHFRAAFATSPHRFLTMRRLQRARAMIGGGEPLSEIAAATGFADQSHFSRHFKKAFGVTPGRWATLVKADA